MDIDAGQTAADIGGTSEKGGNPIYNGPTLISQTSGHGCNSHGGSLSKGEGARSGHTIIVVKRVSKRRRCSA